MAEREADTVVILSSELISKITEEYFNKTMFKQKVEIVDLKPTENGYMFSVAFISKEVKQAPLNGYSGRALTPADHAAQMEQAPLTSRGERLDGDVVGLTESGMARLRNGRFAKVKEHVNG